MATNESTGITGQGRSSFTNRLKTEYMPIWDDHVHKVVVVADLIAKKKGSMGGLESLGSVRATLPQSSGVALFEGDTLPTPQAPTYFQPTLHARSIYTRLRWTGHVERAARKGDKVAWARPRAEDLKGADQQLRINFARMLYLGPYQIMATLSAYNGTTDVATLYGRNARLSGASDLWKFGTHYLRINMAVDAADTLTGDPLSPTKEGIITAIDNSDLTAPTVTIDTTSAGTTNWAPTADPSGDGSFLIPFGSRRSSASTTIDNYAGPNGLMQLVTDSTIYANLYDLDRSLAANSSLNGIRNTDAANAARAFSEDLVALAIDRIADEGVGDEPDCLLMNRAVRREYVKESKGDRRFKEVQTEKGYGKLVFHAGDAMTPVVTDRDCPPGLIFVLNKQDFGWLEESPLGPVDDQAERFVADQDAHEIIVHKSGNCFTETPFNNGTIEDIDFNMTALVT